MTDVNELETKMTLSLSLISSLISQEKKKNSRKFYDEHWMMKTKKIQTCKQYCRLSTKKAMCVRSCHLATSS